MTVAKKPAAKKPAAKKPVAKKEISAPTPAEIESRVLYTIRLEPSIIKRIHDKAMKQGTTHAAVARGILQAGV